MTRALRGPRAVRAKRAVLAAIAALAFATAVAVRETGALVALEREALSARFELRGAERPDDVAVVAVDAKTFAVLAQQWPFPRSLHGRAIRRLAAAGAREIVYDVQFTEPTTPKEDLALYRALADTGGAVLATSESGPGGRTNVLGGDDNLTRAGSRAAASHLNSDASGTITRFPHSVAGLESMAVVAAARVSGWARRVDSFEHGGAWIDYRGPPGTVPTASFADLLHGRYPTDFFRGRVVVVGASAPTLRDVHSTPVGSGEPMAGAEVQANAIWTALHGLPLRSAPGWLELLAIALLALVPALVRLRLPALAAALAVPLVGAAWLVAAQLAFNAGLVAAVTPPLVAALIAGAAIMAWSQLAESRARQATARDNELLETRVRQRTRELHETQLEIARLLGIAVEWRDADTGVHIERIGAYCERLALAAGTAPQEAELMRHASALHDVGKVGVPDNILLKPGKLDPQEWETMKTHTTIGASMLAGSNSPLVQLAETIALTHHEHWDGAGYPRGLEGEQIPLAGRICAVCDVFDALLSARPYKDPWPLDQVLTELERLRGNQLDPRLVDLFLPLAPQLHRDWFEQPEGTTRAA